MEDFLQSFGICDEFKILMNQAAYNRTVGSLWEKSTAPNGNGLDVGYNRAPCLRKTFWMACAWPN